MGKAILSFLVSCFALQAVAQHIDSAISLVANRYPEEKLYIHYDRQSYSAGDTIWFKGYLYSNGAPSNISINFHLQLLDLDGNVVSKRHFSVQGATVIGNIELPDSIPGGYYFIRALTPGMLNSFSGSIYSHTLYIQNNRIAQKDNRQNRSVPFKLEFFPESGHLVSDIMTTVAFKATGEDGLPEEVHGEIQADDGTEMGFFSTYHNGMGMFKINPEDGKRYMAIIKEGKHAGRYPLPAVQSSGINLEIMDTKGGKAFMLTRSARDSSRFRNMIVIAQINNQVVYENAIEFMGFNVLQGLVPTDKLPSGILHFTVFNEARIPLAERLTFVNNIDGKKNPQLKINAKKGSRAHNSMEIDFEGEDEKSFSVSVTPLTPAADADRENIFSRLLLTEELKGYIHQPSWYFKPGNDSASAGLNLVMLTHGWSRFNWKKLLANEVPQKKYSDAYLIRISGMVTRNKGDDTLSSGILNFIISTEDSSFYSYSVPVGTDGRFLLDSLTIVGKARVFYTYFDPKGKTKQVSLVVNEQLLQAGITEALGTIPENSTGFLANLETEKAKLEYIDSGNPEAKMLENVELKTIAKRPMDIVNEKYTSELFRTGGRIAVDNINMPSADKSQNGVDFVRNRIQNISIKDGTFVNNRNFSLMDNKGWEIGLFIDEVPANLTMLRNLRADQIALVKFFQAGFVGAGSWYPGGAIAVYRKAHDDMAIEARPTTQHFVYHGYSVTREFYNPDYANSPGPGINQDRRKTLYWNPRLVTNGEPVQLDFYNNDAGFGYKVIVEGFDATGNLIFLERVIEPGK